MAARWTKVAKLSDLAEGKPLGVEVDDTTVLLVKLGETIHACGGKCTHYGAPLKDGLRTGHVITCPWHNARFDVRTGRMVEPPALDGTGGYEVKVEGEDVLVGPKTKPPGPPVRAGAGQTFAIVGAGAAGNACAETLRREGFDGRVLLITAEPDRPYDRPNLSKAYMAGEADPSWIPLRDKDFYAKHRIELMTERRVAALDPKAMTLTFEDGETLAFDRVLVATGGVPRDLDIPGTDLEGYFLLRSLADANRILEALEGARKAVILGAGFIGLEVAAALRQRDVNVALVAPEEVPMAHIFGEEVGRWMAARHADQGVDLHLGTRPKAVRGDGKVSGVVLEDGTELEANLVIAGTGIRPAVDVLEGTDLVKDGAVPVDNRLQTPAEGVFAAGDIAVVPDPNTGEPRRIEHWVVAERQGSHAARTMLGSRDPYTAVPFFWTRQYGSSLQYTGFAEAFDRTAARGRIEDGDFVVGYYQGGTLRAAAGAGRSTEIIALGHLIGAGETVDPEALENPDTELETLCQ